ncbi:RHS repeat-associated core domain-containing protein [Pseudomonas fluorescens]|uniref:RHS repeat-associated core domain-containing protein n=1 Tax=Pseudomonas fluorescens TaxID=294 RepID=A0A5E7AVE3_PSEFL|nr:RHS repeat-associated core domain-containing protein [Pseudomonas fluorescens]VVN83652.1 hypothetical protein PS691_01291 [Pseudomonas fluorescens]
MAYSIADDQANTILPRTMLLATDSKNSVLAEVVVGKTNHLAYSAYGHQSAQQEVATSLGFNGELREARIGWYLLGNGYRAYNPRLMRFHSPDSWSPFGRGGLNPYMYCVGNPINRSDPTGHFPFIELVASGFSWLRKNVHGYRVAPVPKLNPSDVSNALWGMHSTKMRLIQNKSGPPSGEGIAEVLYRVMSSGQMPGGSPAISVIGPTTPKRYQGYGATAAGLNSQGSRRIMAENPNLKVGSGSNRTESFSFNIDSPPDYSDLGGGINSGPTNPATGQGFPPAGRRLSIPPPPIPAPSSPSPSRWSGESGPSDWSSSSSSSRSSSPPPPYATLTDIRTGQSSSGWVTKKK